MRKILYGGFLFLTFSILAACTDAKDDFVRFHPNVLPSEGHTYSLLVAGKEITFELLEDNNISNVGPILSTSSYESLNEEYPKLELEQQPAFIVFDENGLALQTYDYEEMITFLQAADKDSTP